MDFLKESEDRQEELLKLIEDLCEIPAPFRCESGRAHFIAHWLKENGIEGAFIDKYGNVVLPYHSCDGKYIAFTSHMDTVFKETTPIPVVHEGKIAKCPGIGDDTTHVAAQMLLARWIVRHQFKLAYPLLFVWDTGEEGLGDLRGARGLMEEYAGEIKALVALDAVYSTMIDRAVGSVRYRIRIETAGGHSFRNFGSPNAIERAAALIERLYQQEIPQIENAHTTLNVGTISGGTSINTIAQDVEFLYEFRSDDAKAMEIMEHQLLELLEEAKQTCTNLSFEEIGRRPAGSVSSEIQKHLEDRWIEASTQVLPDMHIKLIPGSTDCNIPLSQGIPAMCVGVYKGGAAHTHEEWIDCSSLKAGYEILLRFAASFIKEK